MKKKTKTGYKNTLHAADIDMLKNMIKKTEDEELDCSTVSENLDTYVHSILESGEKNRMIKMIEHHLSICRDCAEEFELLLKALGKQSGSG